ncbi:hypothetical protein CAEBREN_11481 [Caenorhabditis brenneri]|uniref:Uncharacterized protein n=1 Tax=Caenorhabditis brenneri TaxID=135651 RepID=G0NA92_CAEBE|nr:hypothetical protein CAEBREN_11481 [Caenorhabditis brenneri]
MITSESLPRPTQAPGSSFTNSTIGGPSAALPVSLDTGNPINDNLLLLALQERIVSSFKKDRKRTKQLESQLKLF